MSVNWSLIDFMSVIKTETILLVDLRPGDILAEDHGPQCIARVDHSKPGFVSYFDEDDNGCVDTPIRYPGSKQDTVVEIILRDAINKDAYLLNRDSI